MARDFFRCARDRCLVDVTADQLSLPKTSSGMTECDSYASGARNVCVPDQAPARRKIPIEITGETRS